MPPFFCQETTHKKRKIDLYRWIKQYKSDHDRSRTISNQKMDDMFNYIHDTVALHLHRFKYTAGHVISFVANTLLLFGFWVSVYYLCSKFHAYYCSPSSWIGFFQSVFLASTPYCVASQWVIYYGGQSIRNLWFLVGSRLLQHFVPV